MFNEDQLKVTAHALDYFLGHADLTAPERHNAELAANYVMALIRGDMIAEYWTVEDVKSLQEDEYSTEAERINDEEARQVLQSTDINHDATIGINWDVLRDNLNRVRKKV